MSNREQLDWEARWAKPAAAAAFATVLLLIASSFVGRAALGARPGDAREMLDAIHDNVVGFIASSVMHGLGFLALAGVLLYLGRAVLARRSELPSVLRWVGAVGPALLAVVSVLSSVDRIGIADEFSALGDRARTVDRAEAMLDDSSVAVAALGQVGFFMLALAFVFISINAMRVGLLTRFMGILGAILGALYVIPILDPLIVQLFWLTSLGVLFLGRWPGGRGPAWETGEAIEWPPAAARRQPDGGDRAQLDEQPAPPSANGGDAEPRTSRKRKRKQR